MYGQDHEDDMATSLSPDIVVQGKPSEGQPHHSMWKFLANMPLVTENRQNARNARNDVLEDSKSPSNTTTGVLRNNTPNIVESEYEG
jgi:hypothetical protein